MSIRQDITAGHAFFCGEDKTLRFVVKDKPEGGEVVDVTGWEVEWILRAVPLGPVVLRRTTPAGIRASVPAEGQVDVLLQGDDTENLPPGTYFYTLKRIGMKVAALATGELVLLGGLRG